MHNTNKSIGIEYTGYESEPETFELLGDGDFRSMECIEILKQADIVVTNPPFSLFREYVAQLVKYNKKFLIIGNMNATVSKDIFPMIRDGQAWLGVTPRGKDMLFDIPNNRIEELLATKKEGSAYRIVNGEVKRRLGNAIWLTNLDYRKRYENMILCEEYSPDKYPTYDNYEAIEVGKVENIPIDYDGEMGVPINFLFLHNPEQFDIVDIDHTLVKSVTGRRSRFVLNGKTKYARIVIRRKK